MSGCFHRSRQVAQLFTRTDHMRTSQAPPKDIDDYIAGFPPDVQNVLRRIRTTIRQAEPELKETIKYQIPTFTLNGNVVFFAAFKEHVSIYPAPRGNKQFKAELGRYDGGKGTARLPLDEPIPFDLIARITKFRAEEDRASAKAKSTRRAKRGSGR